MRNRLTFEYFDGTKKRREDLAEIVYRIQTKLTDNVQSKMDFLAAMENIDENNITPFMAKSIAVATKVVMDFQYDAFGIDRYKFEDGKETGLLASEVSQVFYDLIEKAADLKKNIVTKPSSTPSTVRRVRRPAKKKK